MARPRLGDGQIERFQMVVTTDEMKVIEAWRFKNLIASKSEAVRRLCQIGLAYERDGKALLKHTERSLRATLMMLERIAKTDINKMPKGIRGGLAVVVQEQIEANKAALSTLVAAGVFSDGLDTGEFDDLITRANGYVEALVNREPKK